MSIFPSFEVFSSVWNTRLPQVLWTRFVSDLETPVSTMLKLTEGQTNCFLLESVEGGDARGRYSVIGLEPDLIWRTKENKAEILRIDEDRDLEFKEADSQVLESLRNLLAECHITLPEDLPPMASGLFGYIGYDMVRHMERLPNAKHDSLGLPDSVLIRPTIIAIFDNVQDSVTIVTPVWPKRNSSPKIDYANASKRLLKSIECLEKPIPFPMDIKIDNTTAEEPTSNTTEAEYYEFVEKAKEYIASGDIFQVVPSQRFSIPYNLSAFSLYRSLRRLNPSPFLYYFKLDDFSIVGSSPEILVRLRDEKITIRPIAGTRPRGSTRAKDIENAEDLLSDPKELAEHLMLLDLGRNDIGRVSAIGSVIVTDKMTIEHYSHVMHIVSNVEGKIRPGLDALDALIAGFPAGTVSGAPKVRAMEIIDEFEKEKRGIYAGAIGYISASGAMDTCIALRTAIIKDDMMYVQAGGGIVADSNPEDEYQETINKARALFKAAEDAQRFANKKV